MEYNPEKHRLFVNDEEIKLELDYEFNYDLELMQKAVESETVYLPRRLKEKEEILEWMLNYDKENNDK